MFQDSFQSGFLSILYSVGSKPLQMWDSTVRNGHVKRIADEEIESSVIELAGANVATTFITCPGDAKRTLGIKLPYLVLVVRNLKKYFSFEVQILDDKGIRRRFRASNFQSTTRVKQFICTMPMRLDDGWNQIQCDLADFTRRAYGTKYVETLRVQIHANCRIRRIYFAEKLNAESDLPPEFRLYSRMRKGQKEGEGDGSAKGGSSLLMNTNGEKVVERQRKLPMGPPAAAGSMGSRIRPGGVGSKGLLSKVGSGDVRRPHVGYVSKALGVGENKGSSSSSSGSGLNVGGEKDKGVVTDMLEQDLQDIMG